MDKRYQVFISSTYSDLKEERSRVMKSIMDMDCIPAGMELFPAVDEEQFEFIKRIIDDSDYYILIIGGRYGSMTENGISYTEMEFDYAMSKRIPVIAFIHNDINNIPAGKVDMDPATRERLEQFREKVKKGRLVKFWNSTECLIAEVIISLSQTIKIRPGVGWVRASVQTNAESLQELNDLRKEVDKLREYKRKNEGDILSPKDIADWDEQFSVRIKQADNLYLSKQQKRQLSPVNLSWQEWFKRIGVYIKEQQDFFGNSVNIIEGILRELDSRKYHNITPEVEDVATIGYQFICYGVIKSSPTFNGETWALTAKGEKMLATMMCVKTKKQKS